MKTGIYLLIFTLLSLVASAAGSPILVEMETTKGSIQLELDPDNAPKTVENFLSYVRQGFYEGTIFHRVISNLVIQGGGFTQNLHQKNTAPPIANESSNGLKNRRYTIAMARTSDPHSATCQFFFNLKDNTAYDQPGTDGWGYAVFGKVREGTEVVDAIAEVKTRKSGVHSNVPVDPITIKGVRVMPVFAFVQSNEQQPRIDVVKDQGPNAAEWALMPLEEAIPADIRQNLTVLREDLLDEAAKSAKSSAAAYKLASSYCDKLLAALDQRDLARVNAGYAAAQADAAKKTSTQALDARRNHQMSWPQFSREESQRAALRDNEADKADVKKQRLKVEWTSRSIQMRAYLDDLYRQMREAMR